MIKAKAQITNRKETHSKRSIQYTPTVTHNPTNTTQNGYPNFLQNEKKSLSDETEFSPPEAEEKLEGGTVFVSDTQKPGTELEEEFYSLLDKLVTDLHTHRHTGSVVTGEENKMENTDGIFTVCRKRDRKKQKHVAKQGNGSVTPHQTGVGLSKCEQGGLWLTPVILRRSLGVSEKQRTVVCFYLHYAFENRSYY